MRIASDIDAQISGDPDDDNYNRASIHGSIPESGEDFQVHVEKLNANSHLMKADRNADIALDMALKWIETSKAELKTYDGTTISKESCNAYVTAMAPESGTGGGGGGGGGGGVIAAAGVLMVRKELKELKSNYPENFHIKFAQLCTKVSARCNQQTADSRLTQIVPAQINRMDNYLTAIADLLKINVAGELGAPGDADIGDKPSSLEIAMAQQRLEDGDGDDEEEGLPEMAWCVTIVASTHLLRPFLSLAFLSLAFL